MKFWILWGWDALIAAVILYFFLIGLADGSVSSFNMGLWLTIIAVLGVVMIGSLALHTAKRIWLAAALLLVLAIPGMLFALFFGALIVLNPDYK
jgi:hypothetical protein